MKQLPVPLVRQAPDSVECGLACLAMIYAYYGHSKNLNEIRKEISLVSVGTYGPQLGSHLLQNGFKVEYVTHNPKLVTKSDRNLSQEELLAKFRQKHKQAKEESDLLALGHFIKFMENGGFVTVKIPDLTDLKDEIDHGRPVEASLTTAALYPHSVADEKNEPFSYTFHSVIVTGYDKNEVLINDPYAEKDGGRKTYPANEFLFAIHSMCLGDLDNGSLMKIRKY